MLECIFKKNMETFCCKKSLKNQNYLFFSAHLKSLQSKPSWPTGSAATHDHDKQRLDNKLSDSITKQQAGDI